MIKQVSKLASKLVRKKSTTSSLAQYLTSFNKRGYTLVELLVVVGIMGILATIAYVGLAGTATRESTRAVSLEVRNALRSAQEQALASRLNDAGQPADHYGVLLDRDNDGKIVSYQVIRIEKCTNLISGTPTVVANHPVPKNITVTVSPNNLKAVTFSKNKANAQFFDTNGNPLSGDVDGSATITATGTGQYSVQVFSSTGRIE